MKQIVCTVLFILTMSTTAHSQKATFNHLAIHVVDIEKSTRFYHNVLGLDTIPNPFNDNQHTWLDLGHGTSLHIISGAKSITEHPLNNHLCLSVDSVESFIQNLTRAGIPYQNAKAEANKVTLRPDGVHQIYFTDPDGYWIEINDAKRK